MESDSLHSPTELTPAAFRTLLLSKHDILVFTGAGASADSSIPTFRGAASSYWGGPVGWLALATLGTPFVLWKLCPGIAWSLFDRFFRKPVMQAQPNACHRLLAQLGATPGYRVRIITQNVDGLHQRAGTPPHAVAELHGTVYRVRCSVCGAPVQETIPTPVVEWRPLPEESRCCPDSGECRGGPRPDVTLFQERLPHAELIRASEFVQAMDFGSRDSLVVVIGSSGAVGTNDLFLQELQGSQKRIVVVDPSPSEKMLGMVNWVVREKAGIVFDGIQL